MSWMLLNESMMWLVNTLVNIFELHGTPDCNKEG